MKNVLRGSTVLFILLFLGFVTIGTPATPQQSMKTDQTLRIAIGIDPDTLDPVKQTTTLVSNMVNYVCESLVELTPEGEIKPLLATDWSVSEDKKAYTFKLREGVTFHDGTELTAEAVKFTYDRLIDPDVSCPLCGFMGPIDHTEVIDKYTVKIVYKKPFATAMIGIASGFTQGAIISPTAYQKMGAQEFSEHPVGTGPFQMEEWVHGDRVVMSRYEEYWGKPASPRQLVWEVVPEAGTRSARILAGDVDVSYQPPAADVPRLKSEPSVNLVSVPSTRIMFIAMNTNKPPLDNPRVRRALNYAVDKQALTERILFGAGSPNHSPVPESFFGYHDVGYYEYDPERARQLLKEAGYPNGFEITFFHPRGRYILDAKVAQAIQSYLSDIGVDARLQTMDWPTYIGQLLKPREESPYDMAMLGWGPLPDAHQTLYSMFHSSSHPPESFNISFYDNKKVDELLTEASVTLDREKRRQLYLEAERMIWNEAPWIFLYTQHMILGVNPKLQGMYTYPWEMFNVIHAHK